MMSAAMTASWGRVMAGLRADPGVRAVVVTGAGSAFCSGGDVSWIGAEPDATVDALRDRMLPFYRTWLAMRELEVPTIAAVNGAAIGAGLAVALACDLRYAAAEARLSAPFTMLGMHPGMATTYLLPEVAGLAVAREMLLTGRVVTGAEAAGFGLVNRAVPREEVLPAALAARRGGRLGRPDRDPAHQARAARGRTRQLRRRPGVGGAGPAGHPGHGGPAGGAAGPAREAGAARSPATSAPAGRRRRRTRQQTGELLPGPRPCSPRSGSGGGLEHEPSWRGVSRSLRTVRPDRSPSPCGRAGRDVPEASSAGTLGAPAVAVNGFAAPAVDRVGDRSGDDPACSGDGAPNPLWTALGRTVRTAADLRRCRPPAVEERKSLAFRACHGRNNSRTSRPVEVRRAPAAAARCPPIATATAPWC